MAWRFRDDDVVLASVDREDSRTDCSISQQTLVHAPSIKRLTWTTLTDQGTLTKSVPSQLDSRITHRLTRPRPRLSSPCVQTTCLATIDREQAAEQCAPRVMPKRGSIAR
jgi:hypothetical protein